MRFRFTILAFALFYTYVVSYSINVDDLPAFFDDDDDEPAAAPAEEAAEAVAEAAAEEKAE